MTGCGVVDALACTPPLPSESLASDAQSAAIGYVVGVDRSSDKTKLVATVKVKNLLWGKLGSTVFGSVPCSAPISSGERVVVGNFGGQLVVYPADMYEESFRAASRAGR